MCSVHPISRDSYLCVWSAHKCTITGPLFYTSGYSPSSETFKIPDTLTVNVWYIEVAGLYYWLLWTTYVIDFYSVDIKTGTRIMPIRDRGLIRNRALQGLS